MDQALATNGILKQKKKKTTKTKTKNKTKINKKKVYKLALYAFNLFGIYYNNLITAYLKFKVHISKYFLKKKKRRQERLSSLSSSPFQSQFHNLTKSLILEIESSY